MPAARCLTHCAYNIHHVLIGRLYLCQFQWASRVCVIGESITQRVRERAEPVWDKIPNKGSSWAPILVAAIFSCVCVCVCLFTGNYLYYLVKQIYQRDYQWVTAIWQWLTEHQTPAGRNSTDNLPLSGHTLGCQIKMYSWKSPQLLGFTIQL